MWNTTGHWRKSSSQILLLKGIDYIDRFKYIYSTIMTKVIIFSIISWLIERFSRHDFLIIGPITVSIILELWCCFWETYIGGYRSNVCMSFIVSYRNLKLD